MSAFYRRYSKHIVLVGLLLLPYLIYEGERIPANNDIETWLPMESQVRTEYEWFKDQFGAEEVILVGVPNSLADASLIEALAGRLERLSGVRQVWTPDRLGTLMADLGVPDDVIDSRLTGLAISRDRHMVGVVALLSDSGLANRAGTVGEVREVLAYCQLLDDGILLTGAPVVVAELNFLGGVEQNRAFFVINMLISFVLLYATTRDWKLASSILLITLFAIELTQATLKLVGGEMNFILAALPVMVMVFTLAIAVHFVHYYQSMLGELDPLGAAMRRAWKPCVLATLTTTIGLLSLMISDIAPVRQFGLAGAIGAISSVIAGLGFTPCLLVLWPHAVKPIKETREDRVSTWAHAIIHQARPITQVCVVVVLLASIGLVWLKPKIDPLDFLPQHSKVVSDLLQCERELTNVESIEAVVDFGVEDMSFVEKLNRVREIEAKIAEHPAVRHTMSMASFFPQELPSRALEAARMFSRAQASGQRGDYMSVGERYWRISARVQGETTEDKEVAFAELKTMLGDEPVQLTGIAPLLGQAQQQIFQGFWESFATAFLIIGAVMACSVRSIRTATFAMLPNLAPIFVVFGVLGWLGQSIDIGMMMTASIALGIAVDGTFHFLVIYKQHLKQNYPADRAAFEALAHTGAPIFQAALIASCGMLALTGSSFSPTVRFGWLMAILLMTAVGGDLVFLPALLSLIGRPSGPGSKSNGPQPAAAALSKDAPVQTEQRSAA
ncbi:MAG: MMPL family transporter [Planctomycetaceae bacterium]|nr:MMPL family transporter [Planctomycetaceae bacterium]